MKFFARNQETLNVGKIRNYDGECFFKKKLFHLLKSLLYKNGKAQIISVVAGRFGFESTCIVA